MVLKANEVGEEPLSDTASIPPSSCASFARTVKVMHRCAIKKGQITSTVFRYEYVV